MLRVSLLLFTTAVFAAGCGDDNGGGGGAGGCVPPIPCDPTVDTDQCVAFCENDVCEGPSDLAFFDCTPEEEGSTFYECVCACNSGRQTC